MSQGEFFIDNAGGHKINPATEESQTSLVNSAEASLSKNSNGGGSQVLTIASNVANGSNVACRSAIVWTDGSDVRMKIGDGDATADDFLLLGAAYLPVPVTNPIHLRFYGGTDGKKVYILYRN